MDKEFENLLEDLDSGEEVKTKYGACYAYSPDVVEELKQAIIKLKEIKEAKPSEALKCVDVLKEDGCITTLYQGKALETIRQYILKAQELEKENAEYKKVLSIIKEKPQAELSLIQLGKIKTYEEYLDRTQHWDGIYWDMVYTQEEFKSLNHYFEKNIQKQ